MRARTSPERHAHLPWLIITMTVAALVIGAIAAWHVESRLLWKLAAAWVLVWLPMLAFVLWSAARLRKEQVQAQEERALAATAEAHYRQLVEQASDIIYRTDAQGRFTFVNPTASRIMGYSEQELIGLRFVELIRPDMRDVAERLYQRHLLRMTPNAYYEFAALTKDGREIWIGQNVQPLIESGQVVGFQAVARDITERKRAEEKLLLSREIITNAHDPISIMDTQGRFTYQNPAHAALVGFSDDELLGKTPALFLGDEAFASICEELGRTGSYRGEVALRTKDGVLRDLDLSVFTVEDAANKPACFVAIKRDITERKRAEQGLRERSRQQAIGAELSLLAVTVQDLPTLLNTAAQLVLNALEVNYCEVLQLLPKGTDLLLCASAGWRGDHLVGQVKMADPGSLAHAALHSDKPVIIHDLRANARFSGPPWLDKQGGLCGMSVTIHGKESPWGVLSVYATGGQKLSRDDAHFLQTVSSVLATAIERAQAEAVLRNANQALKTLSRQLLRVQEDDRRAIARDLHDEIGQSLTAIKLNVERAQRTADRAARTRIMRDCVQITEHVLGQVRDLSLDLHPSILDDLGLAHALKWYADRQADRAGMTIEVTADLSFPRLPHDIEIACFRIAQEALTNVVRHAKASRAHVTLMRGMRRVALRVQDDGAGFVMDAGVALGGGKGSVGLTSMQERARLLGGEVKINSRPGHGTEVLATLPLTASAETPAVEASRS